MLPEGVGKVNRKRCPLSASATADGW